MKLSLLLIPLLILSSCALEKPCEGRSVSDCTGKCIGGKTGQCSKSGFCYTEFVCKDR